jgi:uncharacterized surface protein with fasciclin (FAS1) repeats
MKSLARAVVSTAILATSAVVSAAILAGPAIARQDSPAPPTASIGTSNLVTVARSDSRFATLARAIEAAGLGSELSAKGPFTLFAPTDEAFARLPAGALDGLLQPANREQLRTLLKNHVVDGAAKADYFAGKSGEMIALGGGKVAVDGASGVKVNGATVVAADIMASNGVIHAIDTVMLPGAAAPAAPGPAPKPGGTSR